MRMRTEGLPFITANDVICLTPELSCERITPKWQRAERAATVRQIARQLQRSLGRWLPTPKTTTSVPLSNLRFDPKNPRFPRGATHSELIVRVPAWSDGTPVADAKKP
jgi:hypothetical protein